MTPGQKILKPLRFLSLPLAFGLIAACCALPAHADIVSGKEKCIDNFTSEIARINKVELKTIDPPSFCRSNEGAEHNNAPDPAQRPKLKLGKNDEFGTSYPGACHSSYEAVNLVYEKLVANRKETCGLIYDQIEEKFPDCLSKNPPDTCKENLEEMTRVYSQGKRKLQEGIVASITFLKSYADWNQAAEKQFTDDLNQLKTFRTLGAEGRQKLTATTTPPEAQRQIQANSQGSATLQEYLDKLELRKTAVRSLASRVSGEKPLTMSPIDEQGEAKKLVDGFRAKLESLRKKENREFDQQLANFAEGLKKTTPTDSLSDGLKYIPAAAPLATGLLANNGSAAASTIAGSSGALPALAIAGAAGAAGMAIGQKSAASSDLGSSPVVEGPVMTPNNMEPATQFENGKNNSPIAAVPATALDTTAGEEERIAVNSSDGADDAALAAALGGGASLMPGSEKSKAKRDVASTAENTGAAGEETLKPFSADLRPAPRPAASSETAGNDVSNLLGKMKDLFNLDDSFGMDFPPPDTMGGRPAPTDSGGGQAAEDHPGDEYAGEEYQADGEYSEDDDSYQGSNPMGNIEVTLFHRVHARHMKCMEKGLVLLLSQELPE